VLSIICAPASAPQTYVPAQQPHTPLLAPLDLAIHQEVQRHGRYGCHIWSALNAVARAQEPKDRDEQRRLRVHLWHRMKALLHREALFRFGRKSISAVKVPRVRTVRRKRRLHAGSTFVETGLSYGTPSINPLSANLPKQPGPVPTYWVDVPKTQTVPDPNRVAQAARSLASLPRQPRRRWSGKIGSVRCFRNMLIRLPDNRVVYAFGAKRGRVLFTSRPDGHLTGSDGLWDDWGVVAARLVEVVKNPAAMLLGGCKRGVRERRSEAKAIAARINGLAPCRVGRKRGRPRKLAPTTSSR
jgi:hypothetical protein